MRLRCSLVLLTGLPLLLSAQSVRMVKDIHPAGHSTPAFALAVGERVLLSAQDGVHGRELWVTDGTEEGTQLLIDIHPANPDGNAFISPLLVFKDRLYFSADDGSHDRELWVSDGTPEGTRLVIDFNIEGDGINLSQNAIELDGAFYYLGQAYNGYTSLFRSDGTAQGTELVYFDVYVPIRPVPGLRLFQDGIYAFNEVSLPEFLELRSEIPGMISGYLMGTLGPLADLQVRYAGQNDSHLFINARRVANGRELLVTDGSLESLKLLSDIHPAGDGIQTGTQVYQVPGTNTVVFAANDGVHGAEPWISDGTTPGTRLLRDIRPDGAFSTLAQQPFQALGDKLLFAAYSSSGGQSLWQTDGSTEGTIELYDIQPGGNGLPQGVSPAARVNGRLLFAANDGIHGMELWITDGTPTGTRMVKDIHPGGDAQPGTFQEFAGRLWFTADDGIHGRELWVSDGTEEGTYLVEDIHPGGGSSHVTFLLAQEEKDRLYFRADDGTHDFELWVLEGTGVPIVTVPATQHYRLFPNPATYTLYLDLQEQERITVYHITGALAMETVLGAGQALDITSLAPGWYFLRGTASGRSGQFVKF